MPKMKTKSLKIKQERPSKCCFPLGRGIKGEELVIAYKSIVYEVPPPAPPPEGDSVFSASQHYYL